MKDVIFAPAALASFDDILHYTAERFGDAQATAYTTQLISRIEALASGTGPRARSCALLMQSAKDAGGLTYTREGGHFLILRETDENLEIVEILHGQMDLDSHLRRMSDRRA